MVHDQCIRSCISCNVHKQKSLESGGTTIGISSRRQKSQGDILTPFLSFLQFQHLLLDGGDGSPEWTEPGATGSCSRSFGRFMVYIGVGFVAPGAARAGCLLTFFPSNFDGIFGGFGGNYRGLVIR